MLNKFKFILYLLFFLFGCYFFLIGYQKIFNNSNIDEIIHKKPNVIEKEKKSNITEEKKVFKNIEKKIIKEKKVDLKEIIISIKRESKYLFLSKLRY